MRHRCRMILAYAHLASAAVVLALLWTVAIYVFFFMEQGQ